MRRALLAYAALLAFTLAACDNTVGGQSPPTADGGGSAPECAASEQSGVWMQAFGPLTQEISTQGQAKIAVVLVNRSQGQAELKPASGKSVAFKIITQGGDATLDNASKDTDTDGLAEVLFKAGKTALGYPYQVQATAAGTCAITFSIDVTKPLRQLRILTPPAPGPFDTFASARIPVTVEATTNNNSKLSDEKITFKTTTGKTSNTTFTEPGSAAAGTGDLTVKTNASGRATVMLATGPVPIAELLVVATMTGTADATVKVRVNKAGTPTGGCKTDADCPLGYYCKNKKCELVPTTPPAGCKTDADCKAPNVCDKTSGMCVPPSTGGTGCKSDSDCTPPNLCDTKSGKCLPPTGNGCDPVEGIECPVGEVCVGRQCVKLPTGGCTNNSQCPSGFYCLNGKCVPNGTPPTGGGCTKTSQCPTGQVCINGKCVPKSSCNINAAADRLKGLWKYDSKLYLRDALGGFTKGFLTASGYLGQIIGGSWSISGLPSFIESAVKKYLKKLIGQYIPPWAQSLVTTLASINDIFKTMRVLSTVQATSSGQYKYLHTETWDLIELTVNGKKISSPPSAIKQVGKIKVSAYLATEVCGVLTITKHKINNQIGGIVLWGVNMALNLISCNTGGTCYKDINQALNKTIDCPKLGSAVDKLVRSIWSSAPPVAGIVTQACMSQKQKLITSLTQALNDLTVKLSLLEMSGTATIAAPPANNKLSSGIWYGVIGSGIAKGNFKGDFTATKQGP